MNEKIRILAATILVSAASLANAAAPVPERAKPSTKGFVFAHRGGQKEHVENTLAAFAAAYEAGVRGFETDVRMTKDGELVIHHDADTARLFPVTVRLEDLTLAEAKKLRTTEGGQPIPTLKDVLDYFADKPGCYVEFELKGSDKTLYPPDTLERYCRKLHDAVLAARPEGSQYVFTCFADHVLEKMREIDPGCDMLAITGGAADAEQIARCKRLNIRRLGARITKTTREMVEACHKAGIVVSVWPGNTLEDYMLARGLGADGICQNRSEAVLAWSVAHDKPLLDDAGRADATGHVCGPLTAGNWNPPVKKRLNEVIEKYRDKPTSYAVFDFDHTIAIGDLTYVCLWRIIETMDIRTGSDFKTLMSPGVPEDELGEVAEISELAEALRARRGEDLREDPKWKEYVRRYWELYRRLYRRFGDAYAVEWRSRLLRGYEGEELKKLIKEGVRQNLKLGGLRRDANAKVERRGLAFAREMTEMLATLQQYGIATYVVSGSNTEALRAVCDGEFGFKIPAENVFGRDSGVVAGEKSDFIRKRIMPKHGGAEPVLVAGDSGGDYAMLTDFGKTEAKLLFCRNWPKRDQAVRDLAESGKVLVQGRDEPNGRYVPTAQSIYP